MKVKLNPVFEQVRGQLGELVFRELRGKTVASRKPTVTGEPTVDQTAHRERFKQAAVYGKSALADPNTRTLYEEAAKVRNIPVFALTIADYFNAPTIYDVDLSEYNGQDEDVIKIKAGDDFGVAKVNVLITDNATNVVLNSGDAVETVPGSGIWLYTAIGAVPASTTVQVSVVATDRPGGTAVQTVTKSL